MIEWLSSDILRYSQLRLEEHAAPATINRELAALRAAYRLGLDNDVISVMPRIRLLPENNVRKGFAEIGQVEAICKHLSADVADAVRFAFVTGWRRTEVFELRWAQVDWTGGFVRLEPGATKNREGRAFPITPALRAILEKRQDWTRRCERAQARIIPLVFHRSGDRIRSFRRSWTKACERAGLPALLFHDLRRSAVRNLERAGISRSVAMKLTRAQDGERVPALRDRRRIRSAGGGREAQRGCRRDSSADGAGRRASQQSPDRRDPAFVETRGARPRAGRRRHPGTGVDLPRQDSSRAG